MLARTWLSLKLLKRYAYVASVESGTIAKIDLGTFSVIAKCENRRGSWRTSHWPLTKICSLLLIEKITILLCLDTKDSRLIEKDSNRQRSVRVCEFDHGKSAVITNTVSGNGQVIDVASLTITRTFNTNKTLSPYRFPINVLVRNDQTSAYITNSFQIISAWLTSWVGPLLNPSKQVYARWHCY